MKRATTVVLFFVFVTAFAHAATTITVGPGGSGAGYDYATIQDGINATTNGDTVLVADGTYTGSGNRDIDFGGRAITVKSENGPETCVIDCQALGRAFYFHNGEKSTSVLDGFTITNGQAQQGGAIYCNSSSPKINNCTFYRNSAYSETFNNNGGAIYNNRSKPIIQDCTFSQNTADDHGGAIFNYNSSRPIVTNCLFINNSATIQDGGAVFNGAGSSPTFNNCIFTDNSAKYGGAIRNWAAEPTIIHSTFRNNQASGSGGAVSTGTSYSDITVINSIFWNNSDAGGIDESAQISGGDISVEYSCILGLSTIIGPGNIDDNPLFSSLENVWLSSSSPCIDAARDAGLYNDVLGNVRPYDILGVDNNGALPEFDMGAYEVQIDDPIELLDMLADYLIDLELHQGIENSLLAKIDTAIDKLEDDNENNDVAAINSLQTFINAVNAQRGKKISDPDADALIAAAQQIIDSLNSQ